MERLSSRRERMRWGGLSYLGRWLDEGAWARLRGVLDLLVDFLVPCMKVKLQVMQCHRILVRLDIDYSQFLLVL